ncbi:MAG: DUF167 domain-containing protein [bacterium]|nr:DUF167 domain-containing protein [bacterium]
MKSSNHGASLQTRAPLVIAVKVIPGAAKTELRAPMADGTLKIAVAAPPEKGKANAALIKFLSAHFQVSKERIIIKRGLTSNKKIIYVL